MAKPSRYSGNGLLIGVSRNWPMVATCSR
jgi:hypothetical protein